MPIYANPLNIAFISLPDVGSWKLCVHLIYASARDWWWRLRGGARGAVRWRNVLKLMKKYMCVYASGIEAARSALEISSSDRATYTLLLLLRLFFLLCFCFVLIGSAVCLWHSRAKDKYGSRMITRFMPCRCRHTMFECTAEGKISRKSWGINGERTKRNSDIFWIPETYLQEIYGFEYNVINAVKLSR